MVLAVRQCRQRGPPRRRPDGGGNWNSIGISGSFSFDSGHTAMRSKELTGLERFQVHTQIGSKEVNKHKSFFGGILEDIFYFLFMLKSLTSFRA